LDCSESVIFFVFLSILSPLFLKAIKIFVHIQKCIRVTFDLHDSLFVTLFLS
jgi:hypothetical protein